MSEEYKVSIPLFEPNELATFDNHIHEIIEEYSKMLFKEKDQILTQRIIMKLEEEIERLTNIINELEKCIKDKYYEAVDYQTKIRQSDLIQGDYPVSYYLSEQNEQLCNYFLNRLKDLQELKGSDKG